MKYLTLSALAVVASLMWLGQPARADLPSWCTNPPGQTLVFEGAASADAKSGDSAGTSDAKWGSYDQQVKDSDAAASLRQTCAVQTSGATRTWNLLFAAMDLTSISAAYHRIAGVLNGPWVGALPPGLTADNLRAGASGARNSGQVNRSAAQAVFKKITRTYGSDQVKVYNGLHAMLFGS
jgi:hypothetical protein